MDNSGTTIAEILFRKCNQITILPHFYDNYHFYIKILVSTGCPHIQGNGAQY